MTENTTLRSLGIIWQAPPRWNDRSRAEQEAIVTDFYRLDEATFAQRLAALNDPGAATRLYISLCLADCNLHRCTLTDALTVCLTSLDEIPFVPAIQTAIIARLDQIRRDPAAYAVLQEAYDGCARP